MSDHIVKSILFTIVMLVGLLIILFLLYTMLGNISEMQKNTPLPSVTAPADPSATDSFQDSVIPDSGNNIPSATTPHPSDTISETLETAPDNATESTTFKAPIFFNG